MAIKFKDHVSFLKRTVNRLFTNSPFTIILIILGIFIGLNIALLYTVSLNSTRPINPELLSIIKRSQGHVETNANLNANAKVVSGKGSRFDVGQKKTLPRMGAFQNEKDSDDPIKVYSNSNRRLEIKDYIDQNREIEDFYDIEENEESAVDYETVGSRGSTSIGIKRWDDYYEVDELDGDDGDDGGEDGSNDTATSEEVNQYDKTGSDEKSIDEMEGLNKGNDRAYISKDSLEGEREVVGENDAESDKFPETLTLRKEAIHTHLKELSEGTTENGHVPKEEVEPAERLSGNTEGKMAYWEPKNANDLNNNIAWDSRKNNQRVRVTLEQYRSGLPTGNPLIDDYGKNNLNERGEMGKPVVLSSEEMIQAEKAMLEFNVNTVASDVTPLNRLVPDSRIYNCDKLDYDLSKLPTASVIIPFYNEWPSLLLRTIYSVINRSPRHLVEDIILVDDASTLDQLQEPLEEYIQANFPEGLVRLVRQKKRNGLIKARMRGCMEAKGDVLIYFDSHMEVNSDWLPPLLAEIARDNTVVAMATLDYVQADTLEYKYYKNFLIRYGWNWRLRFYELYFREDQIGKDPRKPRPGPTMVGAAFAIDKHFFLHLGGYDEMMTVWGGENLEMSWRVWLCGGQLLHVPCSRIGHVPRVQPYSFPGGREKVEQFNYKRAISVWMGNYSRYVYSILPDMKTLDVGDISERLELKTRRRCKEFGWYLKNIWPELATYDENVLHWGQVKNPDSGLCLDNDNSHYQDAVLFPVLTCNGTLDYQAFSLTEDGLLRSSVGCVVSHNAAINSQVKLEDCIIGSRDKWTYTVVQQLVHMSSQLCLTIAHNQLLLTNCTLGDQTQMWTFHPYTL